MKTTGLLFAALFTGATVSSTSTCSRTGIVVDDDRFSSLEEQAYVKASNAASGDRFGDAGGVALSGDTLAVGAYLEDSSATGTDGDQLNDAAPGSGAVYVFTRDSSGRWSQQAYLKASNAEAGDWFGYSVALSGDTLAVGAVREASSATGIEGNERDNGMPGAGAVYVFTRDAAGRWSQQAYLKPSNTGGNDAFGSSLALSGDTLAVGAVGESSAATGIDGDEFGNTSSGAGAVYVFTRSGSAWSQQAYIKASNTRAFSAFGASLSLSGATLAAGAPGEGSAARGVDRDQSDTSAPQAGAVYLFERDGAGRWSQQAYIKASNTQAGDGFGSRVALSGDSLAVSAIGEDGGAGGVDGDQLDEGAPESGAVYVFTPDDDDDWSQQAYIKAAEPIAGAGFGAGLALSGDTLVAGALDGDGQSGGAGVVYFFARDAEDRWEQGASVTASNAEAGDAFGADAALSGDLAAFGAPGEDSIATGVDGARSDNSAQDAGAVYLFTR
jgi:hypothetical protein